VTVNVMFYHSKKKFPDW